MVSITQEPFRVQKKQKDFSFETKTFRFLIFKKQKEKRREKKKERNFSSFKTLKLFAFKRKNHNHATFLILRQKWNKPWICYGERPRPFLLYPFSALELQQPKKK